MSRTLYTLELRPKLPEPLRRLDELGGNLAYAWLPEVRDVFRKLDPHGWQSHGRNPKVFLRRLPQEALDRAAADAGFLKLYGRALAALDAVLAAPRAPELAVLDGADQIAYFCAEFGVHEALPIYSGGLGVLAGDHCKAASDLGAPLVAVGLLYRQGYFAQTLDAHGRQHAHANVSSFDELPVRQCRDGHEEVRVSVEIAERQVQLRLWEARVGRVPLVLLDADVPENEPGERAITHQLYGGDSDTRIRQEIVLGVGGLRALRRLGYTPTVFHINEGHAAFLILERLRERVAAGDDFDTALERVAAAHVFTTHTPVAAGHDVFQHDQMRWFLRSLLPQLGAPEDRVLALGTTAAQEVHHARFNMTTLALHGSRFHNGVSRIHGRVARSMERAVWPQVRSADNPIRHVTNGVHLPSFLAREWGELFDRRFAGWRGRLLDPEFWRCIDTIDDETFAGVRRRLKLALIADLAQRVRRQLQRSLAPPATIERALRHLTETAQDTLVLGFARRFATYKRATLVLTDEARLARLLNDPARPALLLFAGKAHPRDHPGQALIQQLYQASLRPEFLGRLFMIEGYDLLLARRLVQGCDVWLNNPEYPLEACGTSGQKAGINGVVNVSVLDGWWGEGYVADGEHGPNGFAVEPADLNYWEGQADDAARRQRDEHECRQLLDRIEDRVVPLYYGNGPYGSEWLRIARNSMKTLIPRYNASRMLVDYAREFYGPAARHGRRLAAEAGALAQWKARVRGAWPGVRLRVPAPPRATLEHGEKLALQAIVALNGLAPEDVAVECEFGRREDGTRFARERTVPLTPREPVGDEYLFGAEIDPLAGLQQYRLRLRPHHAALAHPLELGLVVWA